MSKSKIDKQNVNALHQIIAQKPEGILGDEIIRKRLKNINLPQYRDKDQLLIKEFLYYDKDYLIYTGLKDNNKELGLYLDNLEYVMRNALNIPKILKDQERQIEFNDKYDNKKPDDKIGLPRYQKQIRYETYYDYLVKFSLKLIHNFYWVNDLGKQYTGDTLDECIVKATPIILDLKKTFEKKVEDEFNPRD